MSGGGGGGFILVWEGMMFAESYTGLWTWSVLVNVCVGMCWYVRSSLRNGGCEGGDLMGS